MADFDFVAFYLNIQKNFDSAYKAVDFLEPYEMGYYKEMEGHESEADLQREILILEVSRIRLILQFCMEANGLNKTLQEFKADFLKFKSRITQFAMIPYIGVLECPVLELLSTYRDVLTSHVTILSREKDEFTIQRILLERILKGSAKMLSDHKIAPKNESEVKGEIYKHLIHVFPDTIREFSIGKVVGKYKPDIGVPSLKTAIEYKFIDKAAEAKVCIGGVYEDMKGYAGSEDWKNFIAVFYMTDHFYTPDQFEAEFRLSKADFNWKPIVVVGNGGRLPKKGLAKKTPK